MKLVLLVAVVMVAFAANSVLNRIGLTGGDGATGPAAFAAIRLISGAVMLSVLVLLSGRSLSVTNATLWGAATLVVYVLGFSFAYVTLDAGLGALILFGVVQLTMFGGAVLTGDRPVAARWIGSLVALGGLAFLLNPASAGAPQSAVARTRAGINERKRGTRPGRPPGSDSRQGDAR